MALVAEPRRARAHVASCSLPLPAPAPAPAPAWPPAPPPAAPRDYSRPLHVDCSVEYELPDCAKPPQGVKVEPLLMIHPSHFRRLDSLRRCPFVNNLPPSSGTSEYELPPWPPGPAPSSSCSSSLSRRSRAPAPPRGPRRPQPYAPPQTPKPPAQHTCDKTFDALQGNPLISPFHAKMFSSESVYQNYPIVMYK